MTSINVRVAAPYPDSKHMQVDIFAGPDPEHRALLGTLWALPDEAKEIERRLNQKGQVRTPGPDLQQAIDDLVNAPMDLLEIAVMSLTPTQRDLLRGFLGVAHFGGTAAGLTQVET